jgi:hypothetical protein
VGDEGSSSVVVKSGHGGEVGLGDIGSALHSNQAVGVSGVTDNEDLNVAGGEVVESLTLLLEDGGISGEEICGSERIYVSMLSLRIAINIITKKKKKNHPQTYPCAPCRPCEGRHRP